jgi:uncharacterized protein (DUF427 family)
VVESVWDYPRPPRVEPVAQRIRVVFGGETIVDSARAVRVLETSHPPVYYVPFDDVVDGALQPARGRSTFCEWKGSASYFDVAGGNGCRAERAAWTYPQPQPGYETLRERVAFYAGPMDECTVDGEVAVPQDGGFYGGWITREIVGPFKGAARGRGARSTLR